jgi:hypothetical protein
MFVFPQKQFVPKTYSISLTHPTFQQKALVLFQIHRDILHLTVDGPKRMTSTRAVHLERKRVLNR